MVVHSKKSPFYAYFCDGKGIFATKNGRKMRKIVMTVMMAAMVTVAARAHLAMEHEAMGRNSRRLRTQINIFYTWEKSHKNPKIHFKNHLFC